MNSYVELHRFPYPNGLGWVGGVRGEGVCGGREVEEGVVALNKR